LGGGGIFPHPLIKLFTTLVPPKAYITNAQMCRLLLYRDTQVSNLDLLSPFQLVKCDLALTLLLNIIKLLNTIKIEIIFLKITCIEQVHLICLSNKKADQNNYKIVQFVICCPFIADN